MSYVSIMTYADADEASDIRSRFAAGLADYFDASLIGVAAGAPLPPVTADGALTGREIEKEVADISTKLAEKEKRFLAIASNSKRRVEWRASPRPPNEALADEARSADLIVIDRGVESDDPLRSLDPGIVLLRAGRPVLVMPPHVRSLAAKRILIAWQDSREARRAVRDCLPFLSRGDEILLTQVCSQDESEQARASVRQVAAYLSQHRVGTSAGIMLTAGGSVTDDLLRVAEQERIDLIVAGAYGHSRLGEWVFGGVTRELLARSPVCCLLSH